MYSQPINLNTDDEYLMGKMKEPEKEDEELKKVPAVYCYMQWCAELLPYSLTKFYDSAAPGGDKSGHQPSLHRETKGTCKGVAR